MLVPSPSSSPRRSWLRPSGVAVRANPMDDVPSRLGWPGCARRASDACARASSTSSRGRRRRASGPARRGRLGLRVAGGGAGGWSGAGAGRAPASGWGSGRRREPGPGAGSGSARAGEGRGSASTGRARERAGAGAARRRESAWSAAGDDGCERGGVRRWRPRGAASAGRSTREARDGAMRIITAVRHGAFAIVGGSASGTGLVDDHLREDHRAGPAGYRERYRERARKHRSHGTPLPAENTPRNCIGSGGGN